MGPSAHQLLTANSVTIRDKPKLPETWAAETVDANRPEVGLIERPM